MSDTSCPLAISSRARFHPTLPPPAMITYTLRPSFSRSESRLLDHLDGLLGRTDRVQPALGVPRGPARIADHDHHARDVEAALGDLGDNQVGVIAARGGDEHVGFLDPGRDQGVDLE